MAGERGSAVAAAATAVVIMLSTSMLFHCHVAESAVYTVQWNFSPVPPSGPFKEGDQIVFQYPQGAHNVVQYIGAPLSCNPPTTATKHEKGNDQITLQKGQNNFICSVGNHCDRGMKIFVTAN